jgi:hypothetical protein
VLECRTGNLRHLAQLETLVPPELKDDAVKKISLTLIAVATLGLAACDTGTTAGNNTAGNDSLTVNEANGDVGNASDNQNAANDVLNSVVNTGSDAANTVGNVARDAGNTAVDAGRDVGNTVSNATR